MYNPSHMDENSSCPTGAAQLTFDAEQYAKETIRRLRAKLLDLTTRNPLIAFKHTGRTRRHIRVIDELPDFLYARLDDESPMRFKSLGEEPSEPDDEKSILFRRALEAAKLDDPEYREKLEEAGADPGEKTLARLERELRQRLREALGMAPRRQGGGPGAADVAMSRGLDPSFDLPASPPREPDAKPSKHTDAYIQTMLFEEEMDRTLGRIREHVRLSIDEAGVNPLFIVFGFLEWYEDAHSETPLHGPLLLYPLHIDRELVRGRYQYAVRSTGEPAIVNVALVERLRRDFQIELPPFNEEEDTPEKYLAEVQDVIGLQREWKLRRWITLGLFSFARIAMYQDLDPARWEPKGGLHKHRGLSRIIAAGGNQQADIDEQIGEPERGGEATPATTGELDLPLIADADSSQLAAIAEVVAGRDLVIEGPPGTGKSQTITNIIAACLAAGKTVLFLAEKMAALNVVKDRLRAARLDSFCLELHSTKGSRKETFTALAGRLGLAGGFGIETELKSTLVRLDQLRNKLRETVEALGRPAGSLGITTQELLWRCHQLRSETPSLPGEVDELSLADADRLANADVGRIVSAAEQLGHARSLVVLAYGSLEQHPWRGVARHDIDVFRAEDIVRRVGRLAAATARAEKAAQAVTSLTGWKPSSVRDLDSLAPATAIPQTITNVDDELVARMADAQTLAVMERFASGVTECTSLDQMIGAAFVNASNAVANSPIDLGELGEAVSAAAAGDITVAELDETAKKRAKQADAWRGVADLVAQIARHAEWPDVSRPASERAMVAAVQAVAGVHLRLLAARTASLLTAGASDVLGRGMETAQTLRARRQRLADSIIPDSSECPADLRRHAAALRSAPIIPFLAPSWWRARAAFKRLNKSGTLRPRAEMAATLDELAVLKEDLFRFAADAELKACLGSAFVGADSELKQSLDVAVWADNVRTSLGAGDEASVHLRRFMFQEPSEKVELFAAFARNPLFPHLVQALSADTGGRTTAASAEASKRRAEAAQQAKGISERVRLRADFKLSGCVDLVAKLKRRRELHDELENSKGASNALGSEFKGARTDVHGIGRCAEYIRAVHGSGVPVSVRNWLLASTASRRLTELRPVAAEAAECVKEQADAATQLEAVVPVSYRDWLAAGSPSECEIHALRDHAERCAADPEGLQSLIDYHRALNEAREAGLGGLLDLLDSRMVSFNELSAAARRVIYQSIARAAIARSPALAGFNGDRYEGYQREFRELDHKLTRLRQTKIANDLTRNRVDMGHDSGPKKNWTGRALIQHEVTKQQRHIPTRELLDRAGRAVQQLMPCFMMSPLSVAQFLKPGAVQFDLVVMDEASQLRPEDAVGAIARAAQIVVVGDPKQLPPTNFFMGADEPTPEDEDDTAADEPSILDQALAVLRPAKRLKWHYRSRHPSLIAFSNNEFYADNPLILFPSPYHDRPEFGVKYVHVPDGKYGGRVNVPEAQCVANAALDHARQHPDRSLGVVALNQPQAELISLEIDRMAAANEEFELWRRRWEPSLERFFVKNLENVQGDERDVIFISTVYAKDEHGSFFQRFGPINSEGGHRRLNVLFTRAKYQVMLFSSMDPADIRTDEKSKWGVRALKGYLKFARDGHLTGVSETGRPADSDFEVAVAEALRGAGFEAVPQVGVAGYFIDLAVRHPERAGDYALGVECDGAMYHSTKSARDRDRLRQEVLERLDWRIHRIWSLDWYRNSKRETERLLKAVREAIAAKP